MRQMRAIVGSAVFFVLAPGVVAGLLPWLLTRWQFAPFWLPLRISGALLVLAGLAFLLHAFARFALEGLGTPAPIAPTERLVVGGVYRHVRNPMYICVLAVIFGQALLFGQSVLLWYGLAISALFVCFVKFHEEPTLSRRFGGEYEAYRKAVPGWLPRLTPWKGGRRDGEAG